MPTKLALQFYPAEILRQQTKEIPLSELSQPEFSQLISDMEKTMVENNGIGLAAPQINRNIRLAIIKTQDGILPLVNPRIVRRSLAKEVMEEGCLSIPGVYGLVKRPKSIKVVAYDLKGKEIKLPAAGMLARVIQHEVDHLDGILFIDKVQAITEGQEILDKLKPTI